MNEIKLNRKKPKIDKGDLIFYCVFMAWPVLQFLVYYIGVNINSILMSFQFNQIIDEKIVTDYFSLKQYAKVFEWFGNADFKNYLSVSVSAFLITTFISLPLGLLFAFYIYKKLPFWSGFRVVLFLPSILSGVVVARIFSDYLSACAPVIFGKDSTLGSLLDPVKQKYFPVLMFYNIWIGFGTSVLMYSNKMSAIPEEIIESAHLDGAMGFKEFWYIVLPLTYSTISVFMITGVASVFVNQYGAYDMFTWGADNSIKSIGYWFFVEVAGKFKTVQKSAELPYYSAVGVVLTLITVPVALGIRWALEHFGPSED